mmetsp:Transcript_48049/g.109133  ORF Transcript_48049/g.109133 Transcript_48049/m.109133 type:complete len:259 (-) Transcript_48049:308-1084(-)
MFRISMKASSGSFWLRDVSWKVASMIVRLSKRALEAPPPNIRSRMLAQRLSRDEADSPSPLLLASASAPSPLSAPPSRAFSAARELRRLDPALVRRSNREPLISAREGACDCGEARANAACLAICAWSSFIIPSSVPMRSVAPSSSWIFSCCARPRSSSLASRSKSSASRSKKPSNDSAESATPAPSARPPVSAGFSSFSSSASAGSGAPAACKVPTPDKPSDLSSPLPSRPSSGEPVRASAAPSPPPRGSSCFRGES